MLNLTRKRRETVLITVPPSTTETTILVMNVGQHTLNLGFDAPRSVRINREEVEEIRYVVHSLDTPKVYVTAKVGRSPSRPFELSPDKNAAMAVAHSVAENVVFLMERATPIKWGIELLS